MSGVVFLVAAVGLSVLGSLALWLRARQPTSTSHTIESFRKEMEALAPRRPTPPGAPTGRRAFRHR